MLVEIRQLSLNDWNDGHNIQFFELGERSGGVEVAQVERVAVDLSDGTYLGKGTTTGTGTGREQRVRQVVVGVAVKRVRLVSSSIGPQEHDLNFKWIYT